MAVHGALIAGSQAKKLVDANFSGQPNDWDLLVPLEKWQTIALLIPEDAQPNKFGGWRFKTDKGIEVDVWPDSVTNYLTNCKSTKGGRVVVVDFINNRVFSSEIILF